MNVYASSSNTRVMLTLGYCLPLTPVEIPIIPQIESKCNTFFVDPTGKFQE